eukprot:m.82919 g.82919  ORF g.82919 m.82919 type:complete len:455 (-) comp12894_c0_seq4:1654-3018(-)
MDDSYPAQAVGPKGISPKLLGVLISVGANVIINIGLNIQKYAHTQRQRTGGKSMITGTWIIGLSTQLFGEIGNMVSYMYAAASVVAPLGSVGLVANCVIATCCLGERLRLFDVIGAFLGAGGATMVAIFAPSTTLQLTSHQLLYDVLSKVTCYTYLPAVFALGVFVWIYLHLSSKMYLLLPLVISACAATFTVLSVKCGSLLAQSMIQDDTSTELKKPYFYICIGMLAIFGPVQILWMNRALSAFPATSVVPSYYVMFTLAAILVGGVVFRDFRFMDWLEVGFFIGGTVLCLCSVVLINVGRSTPKAPTPMSPQKSGSVESSPPGSPYTLEGSGEDSDSAFVIPEEDNEDTPLLPENKPIIMAKKGHRRKVSISSLSSAQLIVFEQDHHSSSSYPDNAMRRSVSNLNLGSLQAERMGSMQGVSPKRRGHRRTASDAIHRVSTEPPNYAYNVNIT